MTSLMKRMAQTTEDFGKDVAVAPSAQKKPPKRLRPREDGATTAPGKALFWAVDQQRMEELEKHRAGTPIALSLIEPNPYQPRIEFDPEELDELAESIRIHGLIEPIVVRKHPTKPENYQIVVGERRVRAHQALGLTEIQTILSDCDDEGMATIALAENVARQDLSDYEISQAVIAMRGRYEQVTVMAEKLGMSRKQLYRYFAYEHLPEFVLDSLKDKPRLLSANAVDNLVTALKEYGKEGEEALRQLWPRFLEGSFQQMKLATKLRQAMMEPSSGVSRRSLELFVQGKKVGAFRCDGTGLRLNIQGVALTEEMEKRIGSLLKELFPDRPLGETKHTDSAAVAQER